MQNIDHNYYRASLTPDSPRPPLRGNIKADICIVGGGFTGLAAALHLAQSGARVALVEAETIGWRASGRNGGQIHTGYRQTQAQLEHWLGKARARDLWSLSEEAKALVRDMAARYAPDCALKDGLVIAAHDRAAARSLAEDTEYLQQHYSYNAARTLNTDETARVLGTNVYPASRFDSGGGHLQPLAFARGVAKAAEDAGAQLYESTRARRMQSDARRVRVTCDSGSVEADRAILACDAFTGELVPELAPYMAH